MVDDAIVMLENIERHIEDGKPPLQAAIDGSAEIGFTILSISLSLMAVFIPLLLLGGIVGRLFREFAVTVTMTIAVSAFVSLTLTPMLCSRFLNPEDAGAARPALRLWSAASPPVLDGYRVTLDVALGSPADHPRDLLRHRRRHRLSVLRESQGLLPDPGHRPDRRHLRRPRRTFPSRTWCKHQVELGRVVVADSDVASVGMAVGPRAPARRSTTGGCSSR